MKDKNIVNISLLCLTVFAVGVSLNIPVPFYPNEALEKGVSVTQSGSVVISIIYLFNLLLTPIFGKYLESLGTQRVLLVGLLILGLGNIILGACGYIEDPVAFFNLSVVSRITSAVGYSMATPASFTLVANEVNPKHKGKAAAIIEASYGIGSMFGFSIGGIMYDVGGFQSPFYLMGSFSWILFVLCVVLLRSEARPQSLEEAERDVKWTDILNSSEVFMGMFGTTVSAMGWQWYSASIEVYFEDAFNLVSSETGLYLMMFGLTYTIATPIFGYLTDKGFGGLELMIVGNFLIAVAFMFLGPIPPFQRMGEMLWIPVSCFGLQGAGTAAAYIGSLFYMMKGASSCGLPDTEQTRGMVTSLWICCDCLGGYMGATFGSLSFDNYGFQSSTMIMAGLALSGVLLTTLYALRIKKFYYKSV